MDNIEIVLDVDVNTDCIFPCIFQLSSSFGGGGILPALLNETSPISHGSGVPLLVSAQMGYPPAVTLTSPNMNIVWAFTYGSLGKVSWFVDKTLFYSSSYSQ